MSAVSRTVRYYLTFIVILLLTNCSHEEKFRTILSHAAAIIDQQPDSAIILLAGINDTADLGSDANRANYYLLTAKARYKAYRRQLETVCLTIALTTTAPLKTCAISAKPTIIAA